ncbi:MAG: UDP-N-acetylmuramoyl-L-alanine--D-glutamate ligase [Actinomycetota bacterium]
MTELSLPFRRVAVLGLGRSGTSAARLLAAAGAEVRVIEREDTPSTVGVAAELALLGITTVLGPEDPAIAGWAEALVVSPGAPPSNPVIVAALERGLPVWSEVELAWRTTSVPVLAITGTNGKTTTTALLAWILQEAGYQAVAAGNIGFPMVDAAAQLSGSSGSRAVIVCEVSSFQLAFTQTFRPDVAIVLNVADDHYDWHLGYEDYLAAKARIAASQGSEDLLIVNAADAGALSIARQAAARLAAFALAPLAAVEAAAADLGRPLAALAGIEDGCVLSTGAQGVRRVIEIAKIRLSGPHNLENVLAASLAALEWGVEPGDIGRAVASFSPLPHRSTLIGEIRGVRYVDDSKATNPHATLRALQGLERVVLIAGGRAKGLDLAPLAGEAHRLVGLIAMGEASAELAGHFEGVVRFATAGWVEEAVSLAAAWASPGDTVLLSPACASLDQYSSYAERGERFCAAVAALQQS